MVKRKRSCPARLLLLTSLTSQVDVVRSTLQSPQQHLPDGRVGFRSDGPVGRNEAAPEVPAILTLLDGRLQKRSLRFQPFIALNLLSVRFKASES